MRFLTIALLLFGATLVGNTNDQRTFFKENGFLVIKNFFSEEEAQVLISWADIMGADSKRILAGRENENTVIVVPEASNPNQVCRIEDILSCYPDFEKLIGEKIEPTLAELFGEQYISFKDKLNFKWPQGGAFKPHQDFPGYEKFVPRSHVTAMITIDEATKENGYLYFAKKWKHSLINDGNVDQSVLTSTEPTLPYYTGGESHGAIVDEVVAKFDWKGMHTTARDLVLFDSFIPHYSKKNNSNQSRRAMFLTYNRAAEGEHKSAYYKLKRKDPQNPIFHVGTPTKKRQSE